MGVMSRHQGLPDSEEYFNQALAKWEAEEKQNLGDLSYSLALKAIALLCLGNKDEAIKIFTKSLAMPRPPRIPREQFRSFKYLQTAVSPPEGIDRIMELIEMWP
jgi:tetratricopeptide (TPR) repeat protein